MPLKCTDTFISNKYCNNLIFLRITDSNLESNTRYAVVVYTGVLWSNGEEWYSLRKFTMNALKELGFGSTSIENRIQQEAGHLIKAIQSEGKTETDLKKFIPKAVSNIISVIVFGDRYDTAV